MELAGYAVSQPETLSPRLIRRRESWRLADGAAVDLVARRPTSEETAWQISGERGAAKILGLKRTALEARMKKLEILRRT